MDEVTVEERLLALRRLYLKQLPKRLEDVDARCESLLSAGRWEAGELTALRRLLGRLGGSGRTLGCEEVSEIAEELESFLDACRIQGERISREQEARLNEILERLRETPSELAEMPNASILPQDFDQHRPRKIIFLAERDAELAAELSFQLACYGYLVRAYTSWSEIKKSLRQGQPAAVVLDMDDPACQPEPDELQQESCPLLLIGSGHDVQSRLCAAQLGAEAYLPKPPDPELLVDRLESLTRSPRNGPQRVLVVDDRYERALSSVLILQPGGLEVEVLQDPLGILERIDAFLPDVVLIEMQLTVCTGLELAAVIRQENGHLPIVFLTDPLLPSEELVAVRTGGDDVVLHGEVMEQLLPTVLSHVREAALRRRHASRDGLTGLLNFSRLMSALERHFQESREEENTPLAFALLDVDRLRAINDAFGIAAGDSVLRSLAHLLRQRLRRSDVIGRHGGDELALVFPGTSAQTAVRVLDEIRMLFSELRQHGSAGAFSVTFSAGVASFPIAADLQTLQLEARRALFGAKRGGRNRVVNSGL